MIFCNTSAGTDKLCDSQPGYGTLQCEWVLDNCPGASGNTCYPYIVWSSKQFEGGASTWASELGGGRFFSWDGEGGRSSLDAVTVRCVLDLKCHYF